MSPALTAIAIMALGKLIFATQDVMIKELSGLFPVHQVMVVRCMVALLILLAVIMTTQGLSALKTTNIRALLLRGTLLFFSFICFYLGLASIPLTEATVLFFTAPFYIVLLSIPVLGEKVGPRRWIGVLAGFAGVLIVLRPAADTLGIGSALTLVAAVLYAVSQLMARKLGIRDSSAVMTFYANAAYMVLGLIMAAVLLPFEADPNAGATSEFLLRPWAMPDGMPLLILLGTGFTGAIGFLCTTQSYRMAEANVVAPFEYIMFVWVAILAYVFLDEVPDLPTILGSALIIAAGIYVLKRDEVKTSRPLAYKGISRAR